MKLKIITPSVVLYEGIVKSINVKSKTDSFTILRNHAPLLATLRNPTLKITDEVDQTKFVILNTGTLKVLANVAIITADYGAIGKTAEESMALIEEIETTIQTPEPKDDTIANLERELMRHVKEINS